MSDPFTPDAILLKLTTPEECEQFAINIRDKYPDVAMRSRRRAVELRARELGGVTEAERDALQVLCAYEAVITERNGRKTSATRTRQMIERHGIRGAVERAVNRPVDTVGFKALADMGMKHLTFEEMVLRHPKEFSDAAVARCKKRLEELRKGDGTAAE